jgi:hypothetical protein
VQRGREVAFPSSDFNARHGTAVITCVGGPTPSRVQSQVYSHPTDEVDMIEKLTMLHLLAISANYSFSVRLHIVQSLIALQQKLYAQRVAI